MKRLLALLLTVLLITPAAMAENAVYYIDGGNADRVHLRREPSTQAESLGLYFTGTSVIRIDQTDGWAFVLIGDVTGYVMADFLTLEETASAGPWQVVDNPSSTWVNLRMTPSMDGMIALCPDNGTAVQILGETADGWSYVDCAGVKGYVRTSLLSLMEAAESTQRTTILGQQGWDCYIHQYIAPNGQPIYFTAELREPGITFVDVNFDGWKDIAIMTMTSAKSTAEQFYVYVPQRDEYVFVRHTDYEGGLINYTLYPEYGLVGTHSTDGYAGALHQTNLYRWDGNELKLIRSAVSELLEVTEYAESTCTATTYHDILHITVRNHELSDYDNSVVWEATITLEDTEYRDIFTEEMEALWQGIK